MTKDNETPEERRERMRKEELNQPSSSIHGSNLSDLVGSLSWKGTGIIILTLLLILIILFVFFS